MVYTRIGPIALKSDLEPFVTDQDLSGYATHDFVLDAISALVLSGGSVQIFNQTDPLGTWTIPVTLGRRPGVTVYIDNKQVDADVEATASQVVITFAAPQVGVAILN